MSGQELAEKSLAGIADILPPLAPNPLAESMLSNGTVSILLFVALVIIISTTFLWHRHTGARHRLLRLAHDCESGLLDSRETAHQLAAELGRYCTDNRLSESNPPQGVAINVDSWSKFLSVLASQQFGSQVPETHLVAQSVRQAERWLRGARRVE